MKNTTPYFDSEEFRSGGRPGVVTRSSADGVHINFGELTRVVGHHHARRIGEALIRAAEEAEKRGAPPVLMEAP